MKHTLFLQPSVMLLAIMAGSCTTEPSSVKSNPKGSPCPSAAATTSASLTAAASNTACTAAVGTSAGEENDVDGMPSHVADIASLPTNINEIRRIAETLPEKFQKKLLIVQRMKQHRSIWLDLLHKTSQGQDISVVQPLGQPALLPASEMILEWKYLGHRALPNFGQPPTPTLMIIDNPFAKTDGDTTTKAAPIVRPTDYTLVLERTGESPARIMERCKDIFDPKDRTAVPNIEDQQFCMAIIQGIGEVNINYTTRQANSGQVELMLKQGVGIWKLNCKKGYKAVGEVATNGSNNKPFSANDFAQDQTQGIEELSLTSFAAYCIQDKFVVPGKLGDAIFTVGDVTLYNVVAADPAVGITDANMFYSSRKALSAEEIQKVIVWVLNKNEIIDLDADKAEADKAAADAAAKKQ